MSNATVAVETLQPFLVDSLVEALESMFVLALPLESMPPCPMRLKTVTIGYSGPLNGELELLAPTELGLGIVSNLLGIDPDDPEAENRADDCTKELLNVVCGRLLLHLPDNALREVSMSLPRIAEKSAEPGWPSELPEAPTATAAVDADGMPIVLRIKVL